MSVALKILFFLFDLLFLNLSILFSLYVTGGENQSASSLIYLLTLSNLSWLFLVMVAAPYSVTKGWTLSKIMRSQLAFIFIHLLVVALLVLTYRQSYSVMQIALIYVLFVPAFFALKVLTYYFRKVLTDAVLVKNYIILGQNTLSSEVRKFFLMNPDYGYRFKGSFDFSQERFDVAELQEFCVANEVHEIYCCLPEINKPVFDRLINFGLDSLIKVNMIGSVSPMNHAIQLEQYDRLPGIDLMGIPLDETINQMLKRFFDLVFSALFSVLVLSWLLLIVGILIKLDSRGPVFFVQVRSGRGNKPFKCLKLRTMVVNQDADTRQATANDQRITRLGSFLRKASIDELPQFINVLIGSMSVVGPRPHMLKHTEEYAKLIEKFMGRHYVKPGITGLAQCLGYRGETRNLLDMENRVRMDRYYIENWTFWLDIKIIFLTVVSLIRGSDKAY
jgi:putative colanic acid biosynthesis UDP-glucose lipid carrier transferase